MIFEGARDSSLLDTEYGDAKAAFKEVEDRYPGAYKNPLGFYPELQRSRGFADTARAQQGEAYGQSLEARQGLMGLGGQLQNAMGGQGPSIAEMSYGRNMGLADEQLRRNTQIANEQAQQNALYGSNAAQSMAASARGGAGNQALAQWQANQQVGQNYGQYLGQAANNARDLNYGLANNARDQAYGAGMMRQQEVQDARSAYGNLMGNVRGQDMAMSAEQAKQAAINEQFGYQTLDQQMAMKQAESDRAWDARNRALDRSAGVATAAANNATVRRGQDFQLVGGTAQGVAGLLTFSDARLKKNITEADREDIRAVLDSIKPYDYDYKNPEQHGMGRRTGIMAQDLERGGPMGRAIVVDSPAGKQVDIGKATSFSLAGLAALNERISKIEGKGGRLAELDGA